MGNWTMVVEGIGVHDNPDLPEDADRLLAKFVQELEDKGHQLFHVSFTAGGRKVGSWDSHGPGSRKFGDLKWVTGLV